MTTGLRTPPIRVLLVEDNPGDADLTKDTMETGNLRLSVDVVTDGEGAMDYLLRRCALGEAAAPDVIVLDLNLPKMSGREVLAEIRQHQHLRTIPVVMLSSSTDPGDVAASYDLGASCYVNKPLGLAAFQAVVRAIDGFWFTVVRFR